MLHLRLLSALVGIPLILGLVYLGGHYYAAFIILVVALGAGEYMALLRSKGLGLSPAAGYILATLFMVMLYLGTLLEVDLVLPALILIVVCLAIHLLIHYERSSIQESALILWGIIYLGAFGGYMILLRQLPQGLTCTFLLLFGVWANDTFAYFIGLKWGRRRLAPSISPQKSVEGACAGIAGTIILALLAVYFFPDSIGLNAWEAALLGLGLAVFAQLGDLLESAVKRQFEVKDTGRLIPGHGGVLDRFDSLLFTAPMVYYFFLLIG